MDNRDSSGVMQENPHILTHLKYLRTIIVSGQQWESATISYL